MTTFYFISRFYSDLQYARGRSAIRDPQLEPARRANRAVKLYL